MSPFFLSFFSIFFLFPCKHYRYGRVQSVKIVTPFQSTSSSKTSSSFFGTPEKNDCQTITKTKKLIGSNTPSSVSPDTGVGSNTTTKSDNNIDYNNQFITNLINNNGGKNGETTICLCATVSFMDIKSASKAHHMEHRLDDRILTTKYYEPSSVNVVVVGMDEHDTVAKNLILNNNNNNSNNGNINGQNVTLTSLPQYSTNYSSSSSSSHTSTNLNSCNNVPGEIINSRRFSSHGLVNSYTYKNFDKNNAHKNYLKS